MRSALASAGNTSRGLTHLLDLDERQAAVKATGCSIPECTSAHHARGLCGRHYVSAKQSGTLPPIRRPGLAERLAQRLSPTPDGCLVWSGGRDWSGYGTINVGDGKTDRTHRVAWILANGRPIPGDLCVLHRCDNPPCCNPGHLFLGTRTDNNADMQAKGRGRNGRADLTHCPQGHEYDDGNTYLFRDARQCRTCRQVRDEGRKAERREYMRRKRAAARAANGTTASS